MSDETPVSEEQPGGKDEDTPTVRKHVDEAWKEEAAREKEHLAAEEHRKKAETDSVPTGETARPPATFLSFLSGIAAQVLIQLGEIANPITNKPETDITAARYSIDVLGMLRDKTRGNLTDEEERYFENMLADLRLRYVQAIERGGEQAEAAGTPE